MAPVTAAAAAAAGDGGGLGLAALLGPSSPDLVRSCAVCLSEGFGTADVRLSGALAAARLAYEAAADALSGSRLVARADAHSWALPAGSSGSTAWGAGGCPLGFTSPAKLKSYPRVDVPSTWSLLTPQQLLWLVLKNTGIVFLLQTNMWLYQALEAEEQALQAGTQAALPPYPDVLQQLGRAAWASWRELLTRLTRSELKLWISRRASSRAAWKVLKDPRESVTGKAVFYYTTPSIQLLPRYTTTVFRTQLPTYAAEFLVACAYDACAELQQLVRLPARHLAAQLQQQQPGLLGALAAAQVAAADRLQQLLGGQARFDWAALPASSRRVGAKAAKHAVRVAATAVCAAAGAGVAGALAPRESAGTWAFRGLIVSDLVFANAFVLLLDGPLMAGFWEELEGGAGAGGSSSKARGGAAPQQQQPQPQHLPPHVGTDMARLINDLTS